MGINIGIVDPSGKGSFSGVGFALPIDTAKGLVEQILAFGRVLRPALGITLAPGQVLHQLGLEGVLILEVPNGSPAHQAGAWFRGSGCCEGLRGAAVFDTGN